MKRIIISLIIALLLCSCKNDRIICCGYDVFYQTTDFATFQYYHQEYLKVTPNSKAFFLYNLDVFSDNVLYSFSGAKSGEEKYRVSLLGVRFTALVELPLEDNKVGYAIIWFEQQADFDKNITYKNTMKVDSYRFPIKEDSLDFVKGFNDFSESLRDRDIHNSFGYTIYDGNDLSIFRGLFSGYKDSSLTREHITGLLDSLCNRLVSII